MNKKSNACHLYKLDKQNKLLNKLASIELKSERKDIQDIFENNLNEFFPKLEFLKSEHSFVVSQNRVDSIAYHERENTFFIIEYKTLKGARGGKVKNQALNYLNDLKENLTEKFNLVNLWNKERGRQSKWLEYHHIEWEKVKVVCISPFFHPHELSDKETILITIEKYEEDILYLEGKVEQLELLGIKKNIRKKELGEKENLNESRERSLETNLPAEKVNIEQFLLEREIKESKIKQWILEINNFLRSYSLKGKLLTGTNSKSSWHIKYSWNKNAVLSLIPRQNISPFTLTN